MRSRKSCALTRRPEHARPRASRYFGSRARGDNREDSDLDLLLDVPPGRRLSLFDLAGIERRLGEELGVPVAALMRQSLKPGFARRIEDDVVDVL